MIKYKQLLPTVCSVVKAEVSSFMVIALYGPGEAEEMAKPYFGLGSTRQKTD